MFIQCYYVSSTEVSQWKENSLAHLLDFDLLES